MGDEDEVATGPHADAYEELYASILNDNGEPDVLLVKDLLQRTGMERMALREIWSTSDIDGSDALSRGRVFRALRLISLAQVCLFFVVLGGVVCGWGSQACLLERFYCLS